jgi:hypothetical protein
MNKLETVISKLHLEGCNPKKVHHEGKHSSWSSVVWTDASRITWEITNSESDIAIEGEQIAWFQKSTNDQHVLKVIENGNTFSWTPITYNPAFGCMLLSLEWYKDSCIFIYAEKHDIFICSIKSGEGKHFHFHGFEMGRKENIISYDTFSNRLPGKVRLIQIPELLELESLDMSDAEMLGLLPVAVY